MSIEIQELGPNALELDIHGKVERDDFRKLNPRVDERINQLGKVNLLVRITEWSGWTPGALWEDLKFDVKHYSDVSRMALVAKDSGKEWLATLSKPFTRAKVEFYPEASIESARDWVRGPVD